jgi:translation initiation factor 2A
LPPGYTSSAAKQNQKKPRQPRQQQQQNADGKPMQPRQNADAKPQRQRPAQPKPVDSNLVEKLQPQMSEEDKKKVSGLRKKLKDIKALKEKQDKGEKLDNNQMKKILMESELNKELNALTLS